MVSRTKKTRNCRSRLPPTYIKGPQHTVFENALQEWREAKALERFDVGDVYEFGAKLVMTREIMSRVIDCWAFGKITNTKELRKETNWAMEWVRSCGKSLVDLIQSYSPVKPMELTDDNPMSPSISPADNGRHLPNPLPLGAIPLPPPQVFEKRTCSPIPPLSQPPRKRPRQKLGSTQLPSERRRNKCGICDQPGHNSVLC